MSGGGRTIAPAHGSRKRGKYKPEVAATQTVKMHGMVFETVVDNAGVGRLRQTAWGSQGKGRSEAFEAGVDRKDRQFHIIQPIYDNRGWKHKNVGTYPELIPEDLKRVMPEDHYDKTARKLNRVAEALAAKLLHTVTTQALVFFVGLLAVLVPLLLALPRIQYEPPAPNNTNHAGTDAANASSTNSTCVDCVPQGVVELHVLYDPMELEDWIVLGSVAAAFVLVQIGAQIWGRTRKRAAWKSHRFELSAVCASATRAAGLRRLTGTAVHWKPQPHLRPLLEGGAHVKTDALEGKDAAQKRVDGRYAILVDWRGVSGDKADRAAQVAKAEAHKKQLQKQAILAAGGVEAVAVARAAREEEKRERKVRKQQERERLRQERANRKLTEEELLVQELSGSEGDEEDDVLRDFSDISSEDEGVSVEVARHVAVTKAKLAVLAFEEAEERKRHMAKQAKADRKKESKKRAVQAKLSKKEGIYAVKNACSGCGESMIDAVPFKFDGKLYCSPECLRVATKEEDDKVARRSHVTKVKFDHSTEKRLEELDAQKRQQLRDARDTAGPGSGVTIDTLFSEARSSRRERRGHGNR